MKIEEQFKSRRFGGGDNPWSEYTYKVYDVDVETDDNYEKRINSTLLEAVPGSDVHGTPFLEISSVERLGEDSWEAVVRYAYPRGGSFLQPGDSTFSFETGGGTQHITQSKQTVARYARQGQTAPNFKGAIGVTADGVEGVDAIVPIFNFTITKNLTAAQVTSAYKGRVFRLTGKVNNAPFQGFAAGEVLLVAVSGNRRGTKDTDGWDVTFRFAAQPNATDLVIGDITGIAKKGWEYLWVRYADEHDEQTQAVVKRPTSVHVERVYDLGNFAELLI